MPVFDKVTEPAYYKNFVCMAANCIETCCGGWGNICIEEATYRKYQQVEDPEFCRMAEKYIVKTGDEKAAREGKPYAFIALQQGACPFLLPEKLCYIQANFGEEALSITCDMFPRSYNQCNETLQRSLDPSCPEAAKHILLNRQGIAFVEKVETVSVRNKLLPGIDEASATNIVCQNFRRVQKKCIEILQDRRHCLDDRMLLLSAFCENLDEFAGMEKTKAEFTACMEAWENTALYPDLLQEIRSSMQTNVSLQFEALHILLNHSLQGDCTPVFKECVNICRQGLQLEPEILSSSWQRYEAAAVLYEKKTEMHAYMLENYLVNMFFKDLFPVGAQLNAFFDEQSIRRIHMIFVIKYTIVRLLMTGMAAYYKGRWNPGHVIKVIQSFEKTIGHNLNFLQQAVNFMDAADLKGFKGCQLLLRR